MLSGGQTPQVRFWFFAGVPETPARQLREMGVEVFGDEVEDPPLVLGDEEEG